MTHPAKTEGRSVSFQSVTLLLGGRKLFDIAGREQHTESYVGVVRSVRLHGQEVGFAGHQG